MSALLTVALTVALGAEPYVRSTNQEQTHCLWWGVPTVTFNQEVTGNPETTGDEFAAVSKSFASWASVSASCGYLTLKEGDRISNREIGYDKSSGASNNNVVLFRTRSCTGLVPADDPCHEDDRCSSAYDCWPRTFPYGDSTIGLTTVMYNVNTGEILDADMELNSNSMVSNSSGDLVRAPFTVNDGNPCSTTPSQDCIATDVQNTVTHEVGHFLGLDHTNYPGSTMNASASMGETSKRTVDEGSKSFICKEYAKGSCPLDCDGTVTSCQLGVQEETDGCSATAAGPFLLGAWALARLLMARRSGRR